MNAIIQAGLAEIPSTSRLYKDIRDTISICNRHSNQFGSFEAVLRDLYEAHGHYHPVHTNNNAAVCVMALLLGGGDFHKSVTLAVMGGLDSDCNGATVGSITGAICGAELVPEHWKGRLNDTLMSAVIDYHPIPISECARRAEKVWQDVGRYSMKR